jgi:hypothetical protein
MGCGPPDGALDAVVVQVRKNANQTGAFMKFHVTALDTSGTVTLHRDSVPAAIKKAAELIADGCLNVEIIMPVGPAYRAGEFEQ